MSQPDRTTRGKPNLTACTLSTPQDPRPGRKILGRRKTHICMFYYWSMQKGLELLYLTKCPAFANVSSSIYPIYPNPSHSLTARPLQSRGWIIVPLLLPSRVGGSRLVLQIRNNPLDGRGNESSTVAPKVPTSSVLCWSGLHLHIQ
jgi:hypothetical protein